MFQTRNEIRLQQILLVEFLSIEEKRTNKAQDTKLAVLLSDIYVYEAKISSTSTSTFYDNPSMVMITCRAQRSANRQKIYKKSADHINSDKIKLYTKFI